MGFVTPALLGGALLVGLPIVLHLIMRREAKRLVFPALRFVERRRSLNQHRLRLRHLLLLALRCAVIALLAMALARPILRASGTPGSERGPIARALVFDNSLRMQYVHENQSRLARSKELASWIVRQLPADNPVTVIDRAGRQRGQDMDRDMSELRIERLDLATNVRELIEPLREAMDWLEQRPDHRGEIYVFTDLAAEGWPNDALVGFAHRLDEQPATTVYLIDVGVDRPWNVGLAPLQLSSEQLSPGGVLTIRTSLSRTGGGDASNQGEPAGATSGLAEVAVELYVGNGGAESEKRGQQVLTPATDESLPIEFSLSGLELGTHQGFVRITGGDPLPHDDVRYFTVEVKPPNRLLLLEHERGDAIFLREALAPSSAGIPLPSQFECEVERLAILDELELTKFDAVCLLDPPPLPNEGWRTLARFAEGGGGVGVFLGRRAARDELNREDAQRLLPARLRWRSREATYLRPVATDHPALADLRDLADLAPWSEFPVFEYWELEPGVDGAHVVASYANGQPALVDRHVGDGRVLLMTTSVSDPAYDNPWNILATGPDPWPFLVLSSSVGRYLCGTSDEQLNFLAGQTAVLRLPPTTSITSYVLQMPNAAGSGAGTTLRQSAPPGTRDLAITTTETLGNYRIQAGGGEERIDRGFSVNAKGEESRLDRVAPERIASVLGPDRVRIARSREEIEIRVGHGRVGRELFPAVILLLAMVLGAELLLANRFYDGQVSTERTGPKT
jgi:hypothetical protein